MVLDAWPPTVLDAVGLPREPLTALDPADDLLRWLLPLLAADRLTAYSLFPSAPPHEPARRPDGDPF